MEKTDLCVKAQGVEFNPFQWCVGLVVYYGLLSKEPYNTVGGNTDSGLRLPESKCHMT